MNTVAHHIFFAVKWRAYNFLRDRLSDWLNNFAKEQNSQRGNVPQPGSQNFLIDKQ